jgi:hypothetical protein
MLPIIYLMKPFYLAESSPRCFSTTRKVILPTSATRLYGLVGKPMNIAPKKT